MRRGLEPVERDARSPPQVRQDGVPDRRKGATYRRKGVLYCPECGHEGHVEGDWVCDESGDRRRYECADCGAVVVSQPRFPRPNAA